VSSAIADAAHKAPARALRALPEYVRMMSPPCRSEMKNAVPALNVNEMKHSAGQRKWVKSIHLAGE
jgi:hypothetical protein